MGHTVMLKLDLPVRAGLRLLIAALVAALAPGVWAAKPGATKLTPAKAAAAKPAAPAPAGSDAKPRPDESQRFLDKLAARGWYDLAVEFLEQARSDPLASEALKEALDYHRGAMLFAGRHSAARLATRQRQCDLAQTALERFVKEHSPHERLLDAQALLGSVLQEQGRLARAESLLPTQTPEDQARLQAAARKSYAAAAKVLEEVDRELAARDKQFPKIIGREDRERLEARDALRRQLLQVRLAAAGGQFDLAQTYPAGSAEARKELSAAAAAYSALYERYQPRLAAYYARLGEGRCYKELGDLQKARTTLAECLEQPDDPVEFREMKTHATVVLLETFLAGKEYAALIEQGEGWLKQRPASDRNSDDGQAIGYLLGSAWLETGRALPADRPERAAALQNAQRLLDAASQAAGEYQAAARGKLRDPLLAALGAGRTSHKAATPFDEARQHGQEALDRMLAAQARRGLKKADSAAEIESALNAARAHFHQALQLADPQVSLDDSNAVRYYLAYLDYQSEQMADAAAAGESLARNYPNSVVALPAAQIALSAYSQLLGTLPPAEAATVWQKMQELAHYALQRWPGRPDIITTGLLSAVVDRAQVLVRQGQPAEALQLLADPSLGPLALAAKGHPAADPSSVGVEAYITALEAQLTLQQLDAAIGNFKKLENLLSQSHTTAELARYTTFQATLGKRLQGELRRLRQEKQVVPSAQLCQTYDQLATRLSQTPENSGFFPLACAVEIFARLATALDDDDPAAQKSAAEGYYKKALGLAERVVERTAKDPQFAPTPQAIIGVQVRQAHALRGLNLFADALDVLASILKTRPGMVDVQVEAAETYQTWGGQQSAYYLRAIYGGREQARPDGTKGNLVWGWNKLSKMVQDQDRFQDVFYQARYNIPLCRVMYALDPANVGVREEYLLAAQRDMELLRTLYPTLGGDPWRSKYDTLLRKIQESRQGKATPPRPPASAAGTPG